MENPRRCEYVMMQWAVVHFYRKKITNLYFQSKITVFAMRVSLCHAESWLYHYIIMGEGHFTAATSTTTTQVHVKSHLHIYKTPTGIPHLHSILSLHNTIYLTFYISNCVKDGQEVSTYATAFKTKIGTNLPSVQNNQFYILRRWQNK